MASTHSTSGTIDMAWQMHEQGSSMAEIEATLTAQELSPEDVAEMMTQLKRRRHDHQSRRGMVLIAAGVVLCFGSFVALCTMSDCGTTFNIVLYGMTGIGGTCIFTGLYLILG